MLAYSVYLDMDIAGCRTTVSSAVLYLLPSQSSVVTSAPASQSAFTASRQLTGPSVLLPGNKLSQFWVRSARLCEMQT